MWSKLRKMIRKLPKVYPIIDEENKNGICTCSQYHFYGNCSHILCV